MYLVPVLRRPSTPPTRASRRALIADRRAARDRALHIGRAAPALRRSPPPLADFDLRVYANRIELPPADAPTEPLAPRRLRAASRRARGSSATDAGVAAAIHSTLLERTPMPDPTGAATRRPRSSTSPPPRPPTRRARSCASRSTSSSSPPTPAARSPPTASSGSPAC